MNIFEELAESYTYNGVVSLKALDDDIVTLENQIDSYNATLREIQLRGKKPAAQLVSKIRDAKIRLSLLKAVYKKESDKNVSNDVILGMLGVSANNAKEVETPETAVAHKEPKLQNFESSELELPQPEVVEEVESVDNEKVDDEEVIVETVEAEEVTSEPELGIEDITEPEAELVSSDDNPIEDIVEEVAPETQEEVKDEEAKAFKIDHIDLYDRAIIVKDLNSREENVVKEILGAPAVPESEMEDGAVESVPPPTIDDYQEPLDNVGPEFTLDEETGEVILNRDTFDGETDYFIPEREKNEVQKQDNDSVECEQETVKDDVVVSEFDEPLNDSPAPDAFYKPEIDIHVSFDLSEYTNMVNTNTITGSFNPDKKTLEILIKDVRDYEVFLELLRENNEKKGFFKRLGKKPRSIFMYVHEKINETVKEHVYEFTDCHVVSIYDTYYQAGNLSSSYDSDSHECGATFKYKKLKIA